MFIYTLNCTYMVCSSEYIHLSCQLKPSWDMNRIFHNPTLSDPDRVICEKYKTIRDCLLASTYVKCSNDAYIY